ncbi:MAG: head-tail adaptor protein [Rhodobacteraceae bacterium]|nr:head-tail adaptor protein [Paracoccaceae bacterium]
MSAPRLNRALLLEALARQPDGAGGYADSWAAVGTLWAELRPGVGRAVAVDPVAGSIAGYRITVRAAPVGAPSRPRPDQRFREGVRVFRIMAVAEADAEGRFLTCFAQEEVAA